LGLSCVVAMKLELSILKRIVSRASGLKGEYIFSVVDFDKAENYPMNFVCLLPKNLQTESNPNRTFLKIFGKESNRVAVELLTKALKSESDVGVRGEIEKRLKALEPKPTTKCATCGCVFEPRKYGHFLQRVCRKCRYKSSSSQ
jgi:hypothetical protein